jgi:hypothetical protein
MKSLYGDTDHRFKTGRRLRHAFARITALMAVSSAIFTTGCATLMVATAGPPKPDLEKIQVGVSRQAVEAELGKPIALKFNVSVYKFNSSDPPPWYAGLVIDAVTFGTSFIYLDTMYYAFHKDKEKLGVIYGPKDTVIGASYSRAESDYLDWLLLSYGFEQEERTTKLCAAANSGHPMASAVQAARYQYGLWGTETDFAKAYMWLLVSDLGGHASAKSAIAELAAMMTQEEIAEGQRRFYEWNPEACDEDGS